MSTKGTKATQGIRTPIVPFGKWPIRRPDLVKVLPDSIDIRIPIKYLPDRWPKPLDLCVWPLRDGKPLPYFEAKPVRVSKQGVYSLTIKYLGVVPYCLTTKIRICFCYKDWKFYCIDFPFKRCWFQTYPPRDVWVCDPVDVYLEWNATRTDHEVNDIQYILDGMNSLLYGATDGQIRVGKFTMYDKDHRPATDAKGSIHFHDTDNWPHGNAVGVAQLGTPANPGFVHLGRELIDTHGGAEPHDHYSYTALMEFCHAYFNARDEYDSKCPDNANVACPLEHNIGSVYRPGPDMTRICGPSTWGDYAHFSGTPQNGQEAAHGMSCYEWIAEVVYSDLRKTIVVPTSPSSNLPVPTPATWVFNLS